MEELRVLNNEDNEALKDSESFEEVFSYRSPQEVGRTKEKIKKLPTAVEQVQDHTPEDIKPVFSDHLKKRLEKQQYTIIGQHSAVKPCHWTKDAIRGGKGCYKHKFYGIDSHQCVQMTTYLTCANFCTFCWRDMSAPPHKEFQGQPDDPNMIIDEAIKGQNQMMIGFKGNPNIDKKKYEESHFPKHFAISLTGEPILYPRMQEMMDYAHSKGSTTFIVTSGQAPEQMDIITPTQMYLSVDAPSKELLDKIDKSTNKDSWERLQASLDALNRARQRCRTVIRITCVKGPHGKGNMHEPENYAKLVTRGNPMFLEIKGFVLVGSSRYRLKLENMPFHEEVKAFALDVGKHCGYKLVDEDPRSKVILLMKEGDLEKRFLPKV